MEFFATCPKGFEQALAAELASLGLSQVRALHGQVTFSGELADAYRACLWSRMASRVALVLARVGARDSDELYEGVSGIAWEDHVAAGSTIAIDAHGLNAELRNSQFIALRTKDAVSDRMLSRRAVRPMTDPSNPDLRLVCRVRGDRATVGIDLTGDPLFRRGYESARNPRQQIVPLRPDYAAALLATGGWFRNCRHDAPSLVAGFAGTGSIVAEAASQALDRAPGLLRARWGFDAWLGHDAGAWDSLMAEANDRADAGASCDLRIVACDTRPGWQSALRQTLRAASLDIEPTLIDFGGAPAEKGVPSLAEAVADMPSTPLAALDCSFACGADLAGTARVLAGVSEVADAVGAASPLVLLASDTTVDAALRCEPSQRPVDMIVGSEPATIRSYDLSQREGESASVELAGGRRVPVLVGASDQFAARLAKVAKQRAKWAKREDVSCYRVYDADLPDYAVAIDVYQGIPRTDRQDNLIKAGRWAVIAEYAAPREVDPSLARARLLDVLAIAPAVLGIDPSDTHVRVRTRAKGGSQYADAGKTAQGRDPHRRPNMHLVEEGGLTFAVNFEDYLDTGIFLDHRDTRNMLREMAKKVPAGGWFCNLFAYTGTATCYAADGGIEKTVTVDMSRTYLDWAKRNMVRNGFDEDTHYFVQDDVLQWVEDERHSPHRYDLVFCDPPTFSNSARMRGAWDVQRDHAELLISISRMLTSNGVCLFSCNLRGFKPDVEALAKAGVQIEDVTEDTIPEDFSRNKKIHHCYLVRRTPRPEGSASRAAAPRAAAPRPVGGRPQRDARPAPDRPRTTGPRPGNGPRPGGASRPASQHDGGGRNQRGGYGTRGMGGASSNGNGGSSRYGSGYHGQLDSRHGRGGGRGHGNGRPGPGRDGGRPGTDRHRND